MRVPRTTVSLSACLLACCWLHVPAAGQVNCQITAARPARAFYIGEDVSLNVHAQVAAQTVGYEVRDFDQRLVVSGHLPLARERPEVLLLPRLGCGIYYLTLRFQEGTVSDAFCVIPRPDQDAAEGELWGFQMQWGFDDATCAAMAQAGVRFLRFDLSWADVEKQQGVFNMWRVNAAADILPRWGLQMIPTLGYTPGWTAMRPDDYGVRPHTWCPDSVEHWAQYCVLMRDTLRPRTVTWPPDAVAPPSPQYRKQQVPLVRFWEIWNEADQNYYFGPWRRYVDLLRVASKTIKKGSYHEQIVYGGSCAHWTEMGKTCGAGGNLFFDLIGWHSNCDIEEQLPQYYYGSPQLGYRFLLPRHTVHTECYPWTREGVSEAEYLLRLFTVLKAWREEGYCLASIGDRLIGAPDPNSIALLHRNDANQLIPNAKYVAYAVSRWLLDDCAYLGPLNLGAGVTAHLFARQRQPMLILWSDSRAQATVSLGPMARRLDALGRSRRLPEGSCTLSLTGAPTVILGAHPSYIATAMNAYFERILNTEYGFEYPTDSPYVRTLILDSWETILTVRPVLQTALGRITGQKHPTGRPLDAVITEIGNSIQRFVSWFVQHRAFRPETCTATWRMLKLIEWLADANDALDGCLWGTGDPVAGQGLVDTLEQARSQVYDQTRGTVRPTSEAILARGYRMARRAAARGGLGGALAAQVAMQSALTYAPLETPVLTDVFVVGHFPTANLMRKATLFHPARTHTLQAQVYNFTDQEVSGTLVWTLPACWSPQTVTLAFTAPANGYSARVPCEVTIPGGPEPWALETCGTPAGTFTVRVPHGVSTYEWVTLGGTLSDGRELRAIDHESWIGIWSP